MKTRLYLLVAAALTTWQGVRADQPYDIPFGASPNLVSFAGGYDSPLIRAQDAVACDAGYQACGGRACDTGCDPACCMPTWRAFGDFLYLRPGNEKVAFAVPINGAIEPPPGTAPVQIGLETVADLDFDPAFRVGLGAGLDDCSELVGTYTHFEGDTFNSVAIDPPYVLRSLVDHPGSWAAPTDFLTAYARYDIDFEHVDLDYRRVFLCGPCYNVSWLAGARYTNLTQTFVSTFTNATTIEAVDTQIRFDGGGIRVGLEGERTIGSRGLMVYGRSAASFVGGNFRGRYLQADNARLLVVNTGWNEDRVVSILDLELGFGWTSPGGHFRATAGYLFSGWFNTMNTDEFIQAVQTADSVDVSDSLSFDGLAARAEIRY